MEIPYDERGEPIEIVIHFRDGGDARISNIATMKIRSGDSVFILGRRDNDGIAISTANRIMAIQECVNSVDLLDFSSEESPQNRLMRWFRDK